MQHPLNTAVDAIDEAIEGLMTPKTDMDMIYSEFLQRINRELAVIMVAMGLNPELNQGS